MKIMEKVKRAYKQPMCGIVCTEIETLLDQVSGQHSNIGQGGSFENAKQTLFTKRMKRNILMKKRVVILCGIIK